MWTFAEIIGFIQANQVLICLFILAWAVPALVWVIIDIFRDIKGEFPVNNNGIFDK